MHQLATICLSALIAALLIGTGLLILSRLCKSAPPRPFEAWTMAFPLGALLLYFGVFFVGYFRLDRESMTWLAVGLALTGSTGLFAALRRAKPAFRLPALTMESICWICFAGAAALIILQGLAPPSNFDSLNYHLAYPKFDIEQGRLSIPWDRSFAGSFFPMLGSNMSRFALALWDEGMAQMLHGGYAAVSALAAAAIVRRLGYGRATAALAALMFILLRVVSWQGATTETDLLVTAFAALAFVAYLHLKESRRPAAAVLFGLMTGGAILAKYHGFAFILAMLPLISYDIARRRVPPAQVLIAGSSALVLLVPHMAWDFWHTGNPIFPLFNSIISPSGIDPIAGLSGIYGVERNLANFVLTPWLFSVYPTKYFDGMVLGAPYLVAFAPLIAMRSGVIARWGGVLTIVLIYYLIWYHLLSQQVRFLLPVLTFMAAISAAGVTDFWAAAGRFWPARAMLLALCAVFGLTQVTFASAYALIRLPPAAGLVSKRKFLSETPTFRQARYPTCAYLTDHLKPGERFFSFTMISFYCPQTQGMYRYFPEEANWWLTRPPDSPPPLTVAEFVAALIKYNVKYIVFPHSYERRRNDQSIATMETVDPKDYRLGREIVDALANVPPLEKGPFVALYPIAPFLENLQTGTSDGKR